MADLTNFLSANYLLQVKIIIFVVFMDHVSFDLVYFALTSDSEFYYDLISIRLAVEQLQCADQLVKVTAGVAGLPVSDCPSRLGEVLAGNLDIIRTWPWIVLRFCCAATTFHHAHLSQIVVAVGSFLLVDYPPGHLLGAPFHFVFQIT